MLLHYFLLNPVHFTLSTSGSSHCGIIDMKIYEVFLQSVVAVQCWQKCWMSLSDKLKFIMKREPFIPTICTHQHMLAWILFCKFPCFIFYHFIHTESVPCSVSWKWLFGSTATLACVVHVYYWSFCCYLFGNLLLKLWACCNAVIHFLYMIAQY